MIIGVDAGALAIADERLRVGVWRVTYNLLRELAKIDKKNEYRLYSFAPLGERFGKNFRNIVVRPRLGWSTIQLPLELRRHPVDVYLGLSQTLPRADAKKIGWIYDLGFLHYPDAYPDSLTRLEKQTNRLIERADHIITISEHAKTDIIAQYGKHRITVAYPGVDPTFTARGPKHKEKRPYILMVGALKRIKNIPFALQIVKRFFENNDYLLLLVGGNYWEDPEIKKTMAREKIEQRVKMQGFVPDIELPEYYRGARALLVTSLWEGFCLPAAEALSCGCPVVYSNTGSLAEVVGKNGSAFNSENQAVYALSHTRKPVVNRRFAWSDFARNVYDAY